MTTCDREMKRLMDLSPGDEERWRWSSYLRGLNRGLASY